MNLIKGNSQNGRPELLDKIDTFLEEFPWFGVGPTHIVLSDYNLEDYHLGFTIGYLDCLLEISPVYWPTYLIDPNTTLFNPEDFKQARKFLWEIYMDESREEVIDWLDSAQDS